MWRERTQPEGQLPVGLQMEGLVSVGRSWISFTGSARRRTRLQNTGQSAQRITFMVPVDKAAEIKGIH